MAEQSVYIEDAISIERVIETANLAEVSDEVLLEKLCAGHPQAMPEILQRYERKLISYTQRIVKSEDLARDVCQDVFLKLIRKPPVSLHGGRLSSWLFRVAHNLAIDVWRRRRFEVTGEELPEDSLADASPFHEVAEASDIQLLRKLITQLSPELRQIVELRVYGELSYKEIVQTLNIPQGTALWRFHEAIRQLTELWRNHE